MFGVGAPRCPRCLGAVYQAEEATGAGKKWHQQCFTCKDCNTRLSSTTLTDRDGEIWCAPCYAKRFGPKGFGIGGTSVQTGASVSDPSGFKAASSGLSSGGLRCGSCGTGGQSGKFCGSCGKPLSAGSGGHSHTASGGGGGGSVKSAYTSSSGSSVSGLGGGSDKCGKCGEAVFHAERVTAAGRVFHDSCFKCTTCSTRLQSTELNDKEGKLYCTACYAKNFGPKGYGYAGGASGPMAYTR